MKFDHAIITVHDLEQAVSSFEELGFTVVPGGEHSGGLTHNALIVFADGTYLELMAPTDPALLTDPPPPSPGNYLSLFESGEGIAGYAFQVQDLDALVRRARQAGLEIGDPESGGRRRHDGVPLRWRTAMFPEMSLPFFLTDETPRTNRVPAVPENTRHLNGATGVTGIVRVVAELDAATSQHVTLFGVEPERETQAATFQIGEFQVRLAAGRPGVRGELPTELWLSGSKTRVIDVHGFRLVLGVGEHRGD